MRCQLGCHIQRILGPVAQSEEANRLLRELQFLVDDFGFVQTTPEFDERWEGVRTSYDGLQFRVKASYNYRDDHDISLACPRS